jgi:CRISPR-associated protein Cas4
MGGDEDLVTAPPQTQGKEIHQAIDNKTYSTHKDEITSLSVYSNELGVIGKIDIYKAKEKLLIERKYKLSTIYQGQYYQIWAQYFCMTEMGYSIDKLAFYSLSDNKLFPINIPSIDDKNELINFINQFKNYSPSDVIQTNKNKCSHCIYSNLCDKTEVNNVYE